MVIRLVPSPVGSAVRTAHGVLHLPGLRLEVSAARPRTGAAPDRRGPDRPGPDQPGPDQPGPDQPGPDHPGPDRRGRGSA